MLNDQFGKVEVLCPSISPDLDAKQWPQANDLGVRFVRSAPYSGKLRWWYRAVRGLPLLKSVWIPRSYPLPADIQSDVRKCDAVLQIGGDNISLDYTPAGLIGNTAFSEMFMSQGIPNILWAASVGPFSKEPAIEHYMSGFLNRLKLVTIREAITADYLRGIGVVDNVRMVADPAFLMTPEAFDVEEILPKERGNGVLGLNLSPLVTKFGAAHTSSEDVYSEIVDFVRAVSDRYGFSVLFIPHVDPLDGSLQKSDTAFMTPLFQRLADMGDRVNLAPRTLNAAQLKYLISQCRFFMGARTHSTIAGFSTGVPTASISYSIKARGLNKDVFGHERFVIPANNLTSMTLQATIQTLVEEEASIRAHLLNRIPEIRKRSVLSAAHLAESLA
jgi:polysaccharide pyruvyl transferase WcaK-like protein